MAESIRDRGEVLQDLIGVTTDLFDAILGHDAYEYHCWLSRFNIELLDLKVGFVFQEAVHKRFVIAPETVLILLTYFLNTRNRYFPECRLMSLTVLRLEIALIIWLSLLLI